MGVRREPVFGPSHDIDRTGDVFGDARLAFGERSRRVGGGDSLSKSFTEWDTTIELLLVEASEDFLPALLSAFLRTVAIPSLLCTDQTDSFYYQTLAFR